jgi:enoyl-CoA hydratase/carnithine racemase
MSQLTAETVGHVKVLRLDRPQRKNALTSFRGR